jgi:hypothetical protein
MLQGALVVLAVLLAIPPQHPAAWLRRYMRASDADLTHVMRGEPVVRSLDTNDSREYAAFGAIRVNCTPAVFLERVRDIERFKSGEFVEQVGRFSPDPSPNDVRGVVLDDEDRVALRTCRPGACAMRLPVEAMERARQDIPWGAPDERDQASAFMARFLAGEARSYLSGGSGALAPYGNRTNPASRAAAFSGLLHQTPFAAEYQPVLRWLEAFPAQRHDRIETFLYWSRETFGLKPVISITHSALVDTGDAVVFASKQVYSSHYFDAALGMSLFVRSPDGNGGVLTYLSRTRIDTSRPGLVALGRPIAQRRARDGLKRTLIETKRRLES